MGHLLPRWFARVFCTAMIGLAAGPRTAQADIILSITCAPGNTPACSTTNLHPTVTIPVPLIGTPLLGLDPYYELTFSITDDAINLLSTYAVTAMGLPVSMTLLTGTLNTYNGSLVLNNGPVLPPTFSLVITNLFQKNNPTQTSVTTDVFDLAVTETAAPEPASLAIFGAGLSLLGLVRRRRARA